MGAYVLGGALQGLGSGINSSVDIYNKQKQLAVENALAKIRSLDQHNQSVADVAGTNATTAATIHHNQAPVLGETGYAPALGAVAGAQAEAELTPKLKELHEKGLIDLDTATKMSALEYGNKLGEMKAQFGYQSGLQGQQQGFDLAKLGKQQAFEGGEAQKQRDFNTTLENMRLQGGLTTGLAKTAAVQSGQFTPLLIHGARSFLNLDTPTPRIQSDNTSTPSAQPTAGANPSADLWEQLVKSGVAPDQATAQVKARYNGGAR